MLRTVMGACRGLAAAGLLLVAGCAAPVPSTPTPVPAVTLGPTAPPTPAAPPPLTAPPATASRVDTLNAANAAFSGGNLTDAAGLYQRVVNTPPGSAESEATALAITDFARFRDLLALLADGREDEARVALDGLKQRDANAPFARLGDQLYNQYGMVGQVRGACAQVQPQVATQAGPTLATLQAAGVTNVDATSLCRVP